MGLTYQSGFPDFFPGDVLRNQTEEQGFVAIGGNFPVNKGLIFGKLGMPQLGVEGAAIATCISSWMGPVLLLTISVWKKNLISRYSQA